jgi:hypothetical protein
MVPLSDAGEVPEGRGGMIVTFDDNPDVMVISLAYLSKGKHVRYLNAHKCFA